MLFGIPASLLVFFLLWKFAGPTVKKAHGRPHCEDPERSSTPVRRIESRPTPRPRRSARRRATSPPSVLACWPRPTHRPPRSSRTAAPGSRRRSPTSRPAPTADIAAAAGRVERRTARRDRSPVQRSRRPRRHRFARRRDASRADRELHRRSRSREPAHERHHASRDTHGDCSRSPAPKARIDEVEDELFRFARSYESNEELRNALSDEQIPASKRQAIVEDLLGGKVTRTTTQLISMVVGSGRGRDLPAIVDKLVARASAAKNLEVAEVRTAVPLTRRSRDSARGRAGQRHRQGSEPEGGRRSVRPRRHRCHRRRHRHRRHRPHPNRAVEVPALGRTRHGDMREPWQNSR